MFLLKKLIGPLFFPHTICLGLLLLGVFFLWRNTRLKLGKILVTLAAAGLLVQSYPQLWGGLVYRMENTYPPLDLQRPDLTGVKWVVVLGGGGGMNPRMPATGRMSSQSLARLVEGIRIQRGISGANLLVSGRSAFTNDSDALTMQQGALVLGVPPDEIVTENTSRDTEEQATEVKRFVGSDRFILVTSALHMPRSMGLFEKQGLHPIAAPTDFYIKGGGRGGVSLNPENLHPTPSGAVRAQSLFREYLGILWSGLRGRI